MIIYPSTTVDHIIRKKLEITCSQYCIADAIHTFNSKRLPSTTEYLAKQIGMTEVEVATDMVYLQAKGLVEIAVTNWKITNKWTDSFESNIWFDNPLPKGVKEAPEGYEPGFWQIYKREGSSKMLTRKHYSEALKNVSKQRLHAAAIKYIDSCSDIKYVMYSERFLDPKHKRYETYLEDEQLEFNPNQPFGAINPVKDMTRFI